MHGSERTWCDMIANKRMETHPKFDINQLFTIKSFYVIDLMNTVGTTTDRKEIFWTAKFFF